MILNITKILERYPLNPVAVILKNVINPASSLNRMIGKLNDNNE
jgi:hypothetical protein